MVGMAPKAIEVRPIAGTLGAEIFGLGLASRCTLHNAVNDYHDYRRVMHRLTPAGDRPR